MARINPFPQATWRCTLTSMRSRPMEPSMNNTQFLQSQPTMHRRRFAANRGTSHSLSRWVLTLAAASLSAGILMAAVVPGWIGAGRHDVPRLPAKQEVVRDERAATMPIYELPPISVVADRKTELAKIRDEERVERVKQARLKAPMKPPV